MIDITKAIGAVAATVAALGGSYTLADKFGWLDRAIINGRLKTLRLWQKLASQ